MLFLLLQWLFIGVLVCFQSVINPAANDSEVTLQLPCCGECTSPSLGMAVNYFKKSPGADSAKLRSSLAGRLLPSPAHPLGTS